MSRHNRTNQLIVLALEILSAYYPMSVRQAYYQFVSSQVIENYRAEDQNGNLDSSSEELVKNLRERLAWPGILANDPRRGQPCLN